MIEDELAVAVALEVRGRGPDQARALPDGEVMRQPARVLADAARLLERVEEGPREERRVGDAVERVPRGLRDQVNRWVEADLDRHRGPRDSAGRPALLARVCYRGRDGLSRGQRRPARGDLDGSAALLERGRPARLRARRPRSRGLFPGVSTIRAATRPDASGALVDRIPAARAQRRQRRQRALDGQGRLLDRRDRCEPHHVVSAHSRGNDARFALKSAPLRRRSSSGRGASRAALARLGVRSARGGATMKVRRRS